MKIIEYAAEGEPISDFTVEQRAADFLRGEAETIKVSSRIFIQWCRVFIKTEMTSHQEVSFLLKGKSYQANKDGRLPFEFFEDADFDGDMRCLERLVL